MPVGELIEFGLRVGFDVLLAVGGDQTRTAAVVRAVLFGVGAVLLALILLTILQRLEPDDLDLWPVAGTLVLALVGAFFAWRLVREFRLLWHWGEPTVMASKAGLVLSKRDRILRWEEIASVTPERRGARGRVRIRLADQPQGDVFIATRKPEALVSAILGIDALKGLAK
jgi:hypothetical protein